MSDDEENYDVTPVYQGVRLWDDEYQALRLISLLEGKNLRDLYAEAYAQATERRRVWQANSEIPLERFLWRASPQPGERRKRFTVGVLAFEIAELQEWAEYDGVALVDVCYTAVYEYLISYGPLKVVGRESESS